MAKIPQNLNNPFTGVLAEANPIKSGGKFYYDGTSNLSAIHINCSVLSLEPRSCVHNGNCGNYLHFSYKKWNILSRHSYLYLGWCGSSNTCVEGNSAGPLGNCLRSTFLYSQPSSTWNPLKAGTINILGQNKSGGNSFILTPEPDLNKISVK